MLLIAIMAALQGVIGTDGNDGDVSSQQKAASPTSISLKSIVPDAQEEKTTTLPTTSASANSQKEDSPVTSKKKGNKSQNGHDSSDISVNPTSVPENVDQSSPPLSTSASTPKDSAVDSTNVPETNQPLSQYEESDQEFEISFDIFK